MSDSNSGSSSGSDDNENETNAALEEWNSLEEFQKLEKFLAAFKLHNRYDPLLGLSLQVQPTGDLFYHLTVQEKHLSSPDACHGGVLSGMMDATLGLAAIKAALKEGKICSTVEFKINYLGPARLGDVLQGIGKVEFKGSSLIVATADITNQQNNKLIAKGMGTFNLYPLSKKAKTYGVSTSTPSP